MLKKVGGIVALVGLILAIMTFREGIAALKDPIDLYAYETNVSEVGYFDLVTVDVFEVYGSYATQTTTKNGTKTNEDSYYVIPAHEGDEYRYIGIRVNEKEYAKFDKIYEDTYDYYDGYSTEIKDYGIVKTGLLKKMSKKMQDYYYGTLKKAEWYDTDEEMKKEAIPYYLDPISNPKTSLNMLIFGVIAFLGGGIAFVLGWRSEDRSFNKAASQTYVMIDGISYAKADLAHVNQCIQNQEKVFATQELSKITGMSMEDAAKVVENWRYFYY